MDETALMSPMDMIYPWDRQLGEELEDYALFRKWRDMGGNASVEDLSEVSGKPPTTILGLSRKWQWEQRAIAYRKYLDEAMSEFRTKIIEGTEKESLSILGETLLTRLNQLMFKVLSEDPGSVKDIMRDIKSLAGVYDVIHKASKTKAEKDKKTRAVNIMFVPHGMDATVEAEVVDVD